MVGDTYGSVVAGQNSSAPAPPVLTGSSPSIGGSAVQGQVLTESHGSWSNSPTGYAYQWEDCDSSGGNCAAISGATSQTYTLSSADVGHTIVVQETASNAGGTSSPASSPATAVVKPLPPAASSPAPAISGTTTVGQTLTESHGGWTNSPTGYAYQWEDCDSSGGNCAAISGATSQTYTLSSADVGHTIVVQETASNAGGSSSPASSAATGVVVAASTPGSKPSNSSPPVISGTATVGQSLSTSTGAWSGTAPISYSYQWARCSSTCIAISSATTASYTLTTAEASGDKIVVLVTATNSAGSATATSSGVGPVTAAATGPSSAQVKAALAATTKVSGKTATTKAIAKAGGYTFSFSAPSAGSW